MALAEKVSSMPSPGVKFWTTYAKLCTQCAVRKANKKPVRKETQAASRVFEQAVLLHGTELEIWLQWIRFLEATGGGEAALVHQRAVATLPESAADSLTLMLRDT